MDLHGSKVGVFQHEEGHTLRIEIGDVLMKFFRETRADAIKVTEEKAAVPRHKKKAASHALYLQALRACPGWNNATYHEETRKALKRFPLMEDHYLNVLALYLYESGLTKTHNFHMDTAPLLADFVHEACTWASSSTALQTLEYFRSHKVNSAIHLDALRAAIARCAQRVKKVAKTPQELAEQKRGHVGVSNAPTHAGPGLPQPLRLQTEIPVLVKPEEDPFLSEESGVSKRGRRRSVTAVVPRSRNQSESTRIHPPCVTRVSGQQLHQRAKTVVPKRGPAAGPCSGFGPGLEGVEEEVMEDSASFAIDPSRPPTRHSKASHVVKEAQEKKEAKRRRLPPYFPHPPERKTQGRGQTEPPPPFAGGLAFFSQKDGSVKHPAAPVHGMGSAPTVLMRAVPIPMGADSATHLLSLEEEKAKAEEAEEAAAAKEAVHKAVTSPSVPSALSFNLSDTTAFGDEGASLSQNPPPPPPRKKAQSTAKAPKPIPQSLVKTKERAKAMTRHSAKVVMKGPASMILTSRRTSASSAGAETSASRAKSAISRRNSASSRHSFVPSLVSQVSRTRSQLSIIQESRADSIDSLTIAE